MHILVILILLLGCLASHAADTRGTPSFQSFDTNDFIISDYKVRMRYAASTSGVVYINQTFVTNLTVVNQAVSNMAAANIHGTTNYLMKFGPDSFSGSQSIAKQVGTSSILIEGTPTDEVGLETYFSVKASNVWDKCNARYWGAKGDGATDDTTALLNWLDWGCTTTNSLFLPPGIYLIDESLRITNGAVSLRGSGKSTVLQMTAGTNAVCLDPGPSNYYGSEVSHLEIKMGFLPNATGIYFASGGGITMAHHIYITDLGANSIGVATGDHYTVNNVSLQQIRVATTGGGSSTGFSIGADNTTMIDCDYSGGLGNSSGDGIIFPTGISGVRVYGGEITLARRGIAAPGTAGGPLGIKFDSVRMEANTDYGYFLEGFDNANNRLRGVVIENPYITGDTPIGIHAQAVDGLRVVGGCHFGVRDYIYDIQGAYVHGILEVGGIQTAPLAVFSPTSNTNHAGLSIIADAYFGHLQSPVVIDGDGSSDLYKSTASPFEINTAGGAINLRQGVNFAKWAVIGSMSVPNAAAETTYLRGAVKNDNTAVGDGAVRIEDELQVTSYANMAGITNNGRLTTTSLVLTGGDIDTLQATGVLNLYAVGGYIIARTNFQAVLGAVIGSTSVPDASSPGLVSRGPLSSDNTGIDGGYLSINDDAAVHGNLVVTNANGNQIKLQSLDSASYLFLYGTGFDATYSTLSHAGGSGSLSDPTKLDLIGGSAALSLSGSTILASAAASGGLIRHEGFVSPGGNYAYLDISHTGTNGFGLIQSTSAGTAGSARPIKITGGARGSLIIDTHTPASSAETNFVGAVCWDASYIYVWTAVDTNKRIPLQTW